jgi:hypothetical protein
MERIIACPRCNGKLRVPEGLLGQPVRCAGCNETFTAAAPGSQDPAETLPTQHGPPPTPGLVGAVEIKLTIDDEPPAPPRQQPRSDPEPGERSDRAPPRLADEHDDLQTCPKCGKHLHRDSRRCYNCGARLRGRPDDDDDREPYHAGRQRRDVEPHRGGLVLAMGIASLVLLPVCGVVGLALGIPAWVMGQIDLRKINANQMDRDGYGLTQGGWICGIIGTALNVLMTIGCFGFVTLAYLDSTSRPTTKSKFNPPPPAQKWQVPNGPPGR